MVQLVNKQTIKSVTRKKINPLKGKKGAKSRLKMTNASERIIDDLVLTYLISQGCVKTAGKLMEIRPDCKNLAKKLNYSNIFTNVFILEDILSLYSEVKLKNEIHEISEALIYKHLKEQKYDQTAKNLLNLRKKSEFFQLPENINLEDVIRNSNPVYSKRIRNALKSTKPDYFVEELEKIGENEINNLEDVDVTRNYDNELISAERKSINLPVVRRSERIKNSALKSPKPDFLVEELKKIGENDCTLPLKIVYNLPEKNRGIIATKKFFKGDFVVEYSGELISEKTAKDRELQYTHDKVGSYMYFFQTKGQKYCIDATAETGRYGRLINHSRLHANLLPKVKSIGDIPRLILIAKQDIDTGTELLYDYGDKSKKSRDAFPWLEK